MLFHLLVGVPAPVKDALRAANISAAENNSRCLRSVHAEIESAFNQVPLPVKCALDDASSSSRIVDEKNLSALYSCFKREFDKMEEEHRNRVNELEHEIIRLKRELTKQQLNDAYDMQYSLHEQQKNNGTMAIATTKADTILKTQPDHDHHVLASSKPSSLTKETLQQLNVEHNQVKLNDQINELLPAQHTNHSAFPFTTHLPNVNMCYPTEQMQHQECPQEKTSSHGTSDSGSLHLILKAISQADQNMGQLTEANVGADNGKQSTNQRNQSPPSEEKGETKPNKNEGSTSRARGRCKVPECTNRRVQGGVCLSHGAVRRLCDVPGCTKRTKKMGKCSAHGPRRKLCEEEECTRVAVQGGKCIRHGARKKMCSVEGCSKQCIIEGTCKKHYNEKHGPPPRKKRKSKNEEEYLDL